MHEEEIIGTKGKLVDLFNENLTQEEWNALCTVRFSFGQPI